MPIEVGWGSGIYTFVIYIYTDDICHPVGPEEYNKVTRIFKCCGRNIKKLLNLKEIND